MRLHKIQMRHCAPKDCKESILLYVLADSDAQVLARLDDRKTHYTWGGWKEKSEEPDDDGNPPEPIEIYDDKWNVIGTETCIERMLRLRGEFNDPDASYEDAYYGVTHYGWSEGVEISDEDAATLIRLGIAEDWRESPHD